MSTSPTTRKPLAVGEELPPRVATVTQEGISAFHEAFGGSNPLHTDPSIAHQSGFGAPLQHGVRTLYPIFAMLFEHYGPGVVSGGAMEAKFIAPVVPGDVITCRCRAIERRQDGTRQLLVFETWAENQKRDKVLVGTASGRESAR